MEIHSSIMTFDTNEIDHILTLDKHSSLQRDILKTFNQHAYYRYKQIRDRYNKWNEKDITIDKVRAGLADENEISYIEYALQIGREEIFYIIDYADKNLEHVR